MFLTENSLIMTIFISGFIVALVLAAFVIICITYCMFFKERHKPEYHQYNIADIRHKNFLIAQEIERENAKLAKEGTITAGILILPTSQKQVDFYAKRPDYPELAARNLDSGTKELVEIFNENATVDVKNANVDNLDNDRYLECKSSSQYHSDV